MAKRRRYQKRSPIWSWISFILFGAIISLLGYAVISKKSPSEVLNSLWSSDVSADDISRLSKKELIAKIEDMNLKVDELTSQLEECKNDDGYNKGIVETTSPTLNLRSEPSLESEIILRIPTQSKVSIMYYDERRLLLDGAMGQWCRIKYAEQEGWVWGNYVKEI